MTLSETALCQELERPFRYFDSIGSTNDEAKQWLLDGAPAGALVIADHQTQGRGRKGRVWQTPPASALAMSVILRPPTRLMPCVFQAGALAVYDLAEDIGCAAISIKWPNDVLVGGKKAAGILPEAVWDGGDAVGVVLGVGVNVRVDFSGTELANRAVSLESAVNRPLHRAILTRELLRRIDEWASRMGEPSLFSAWKARLDTLGRRVEISGLCGKAVDVDSDGSLLIRDNAGFIHAIRAGDLSIIAQSGAGK